MKKILIFCLATILLFSMSVSAFAQTSGNLHTDWGIDVNTERDMINGQNAYRDFMDQFEDKGLSMSQIKSLQSLGYSYNQIVQLSPMKLKALLPSYGLRTLRAAPSGFIKVTGCGAAASSTVYFHPDTGYKVGTWSANGGSSTHTKIDNLAKGVYGSTSGVTRYYHYWGHWTDDFKTHQGVDMYKSEGDAIKTVHGGKVVTVGATGRVGIYNDSKKVTYFYAHMKNRPVSVGKQVSAGDLIGYQSNVDAGGSHLHFEVRAGETSSMGLQNESLNTKNPYNYL